MLPQASDEKLITKALNGSQRSWVRIVKRYEGLVYNYCLRMTCNRSDAMDLMQEVFLSVYRNLPSYQGNGRFKAWMMRIAANKTVDFLRARSRTLRYVGDEHNQEHVEARAAPECCNPEFIHEQSSDNMEIYRTMAALSDEQRLVVELKFFEHFTFEEISLLTGVPVNTVKSRLYAALRKLKDHLEEQHVV